MNPLFFLYIFTSFDSLPRLHYLIIPPLTLPFQSLQSTFSTYLPVIIFSFTYITSFLHLLSLSPSFIICIHSRLSLLPSSCYRRLLPVPSFMARVFMALCLLLSPLLSYLPSSIATHGYGHCYLSCYHLSSFCCVSFTFSFECFFYFFFIDCFCLSVTVLWYALFLLFLFSFI